MNLKSLFSATALCGLLFASHTCFADTLKLESVGGQNAGGVYVYPYNFSVNGSSSSTALMCMDFNREVGIGEQWNVSVQNVASLTGASAVQYRAEAYLFSLLTPTASAATIQAVQFAAWDIFDPAVTSNSGWQNGDMQMVNTAMSKAQNASLINSGFFSQFQIYTPLTDASSKRSWGSYGTPQEFIGRVAPTPEPSSMMLLGTGLLACGFFMRRVNSRSALQTASASAPRAY